MQPGSWIRYLLLTICLLALGCDEAASRAQAGLQPSGARLESPDPRKAAPQPASRGDAAALSRVEAPAGEVAPAAQAPQSAPEAPTQALSSAAPLLETRVEREGDTWTARWRVTNRGSRPIYLVTQLPTLQGGEQVPAPQAIYRRSEDETLYLTKRLWRVPASVDALITMVPFLTRLEPGQAHSGGVRIPAALRESYPYQDGYRRAGIARLVISFGYFDAAAEPTASPKHPGLYRVPYSALGQQRYLTSEAASVRLVVR